MNFRKITISPTSNGLVVEVGCFKLVYPKENFKPRNECPYSFLGDLELYLDDPRKTESMIRERWHIKDQPVEGDGEQSQESRPTLPRNYSEIGSEKRRSSE